MRRFLRALIVSGWLLATAAGPLGADIATDGSLGPMVELTGPDMQIGAELGQTRGTNLFHSFQRFNIPTDQSATFTGPDHIQNVIGRVTGGQTSNIDGQLRSEVGQADVYLINPAGVVMGPKATVDVPASLHVSTASELRFKDGSRFSATDPGASSLTLAAPEAFGFLGQQSAANLQLNGSQLQVQPGETLSLSAGDIAITGTQEHTATLTAAGGSLRLDAVGQSQIALPIATPWPNQETNIPHQGQMNITTAKLDTSGNGGGLITASAGRAHLTDTRLIAENRGVTDASGGISIATTGRLSMNLSQLLANTVAAGQGGIVSVDTGKLWMNAATIATNAYFDPSIAASDPIGAAGKIDVRTQQNMRLQNDSLIQSATAAQGAAGDLRVEVGGRLDMLNGAQLWSGTFSDADSGTLQLSATSVRLDGGGLADVFTSIATTAETGSSGHAGDIGLQVTRTLEVLNGAEISSSTSGYGQAGDLKIAAGALELDGGDPAVFGTSIDGFRGIGSNAYSGSSGNAGNIDLYVDGHLSVVNGAQITSSTWASGDAGNLRISADNVRMDSAYTGFTGIASSAEPGSTGNAGSISLKVAKTLEILSGAAVSTVTWGRGDGGRLSIRAGTVNLDGGYSGQVTGIASHAYPGSTGDAGTIRLYVDDLLQVQNGAEIASNTWATGNAGTLEIAADRLRLDNGGLEDQPTIISSRALASSTGNAGFIGLDIHGLLEVLNGAWISTSTFGTGDALGLSIAAGAAYIDDNGLLGQSTGIASSAGSSASGNGGTLSLQIEGRLDILNGARILSTTAGSGDAGTVNIQAGSIQLDAGPSNQGTAITSNAVPNSTGNAGTLNIDARDGIAVRKGAEISSNTFAVGNAGTIHLRTADLMLADGFIASLSSGADSGQPGNIRIAVPQIDLGQGSWITIQTEQTPGDQALRVDQTHRIHVDTERLIMNDSVIDATSFGTVPAATVVVNADTLQLTNNSRITTQSLAADAGPITLTGGYLWLQDSQITTSAEGMRGNGGNINLAPQQLILDGGFIQANTAAIGASGGDIKIGSQALIASHDQIEIGGLERADFIPGSGQNVIQAAAPLGIQGDIALATPDLDITATLVPLRTPFEDPNALLSDLCQIADTSNTSALVKQGRGGVPPDASGSVSAMLDSERLKRLLRDH
ncbi:filamentous hemagglutinin N-terminal domain-containing protein [Rhabdochromatium marinum]|uniref:two-partner secretion domain-containing protein n=1 Tax=Rhabdochromatium marinum TaxID=48729 RepID=UPI0019052563|nr:filamentous hemagglutinin N-terminal domain-containing protein [Rhabdochromatium marinum]MBK1648966.1 hypothetical protein [Rhabdochromatium marinum]